jgi:hypothetical protein
VACPHRWPVDNAAGPLLPPFVSRRVTESGASQFPGIVFAEAGCSEAFGLLASTLILEQPPEPRLVSCTLPCAPRPLQSNASTATPQGHAPELEHGGHITQAQHDAAAWDAAAWSLPAATNLILRRPSAHNPKEVATNKFHSKHNKSPPSCHQFIAAGQPSRRHSCAHATKPGLVKGTQTRHSPGHPGASHQSSHRLFRPL